MSEQAAGKPNARKTGSIANWLTCSRVYFSLGLLACPVFSAPFIALYVLAGLTDLLDGPLARRLGTESEAGARLDTAADIVFTAVCLFKVLPVAGLHRWLWFGTAVVAAVKGVNFISGFVLQKRFVSLHTRMNKLTGGLLFLFPLTLGRIPVTYSGAVLLCCALYAAVEEGHFIRTAEPVDTRGRRPAKEQR